MDLTRALGDIVYIVVEWPVDDIRSTAHLAAIALLYRLEAQLDKEEAVIADLEYEMETEWLLQDVADYLAA